MCHKRRTDLHELSIFGDILRSRQARITGGLASKGAAARRRSRAMNTTPRADMSTAPASSSQYSRFVPLLESPRTLGIKAAGKLLRRARKARKQSLPNSGIGYPTSAEALPELDDPCDTGPQAAHSHHYSVFCSPTINSFQH